MKKYVQKIEELIDQGFELILHDTFPSGEAPIKGVAKDGYGYWLVHNDTAHWKTQINTYVLSHIHIKTLRGMGSSLPIFDMGEERFEDQTSPVACQDNGIAFVNVRSKELIQPGQFIKDLTSELDGNALILSYQKNEVGYLITSYWFNSQLVQDLDPAIEDTLVIYEIAQAYPTTMGK